MRAGDATAYHVILAQQMQVRHPHVARLLMIKDSRHLVTWDQAETFNHAVLDFLGQQGQASLAQPSIIE